MEDDADTQGPQRLVFVNGDTYAGAVTGGVPNGAGVFAFAGGGGRYEGEVRIISIFHAPGWELQHTAA